MSENQEYQVYYSFLHRNEDPYRAEGYKVYRQDGLGAEYNLIQTLPPIEGVDGEPIKITGVDTVSDCGVVYNYRVSAYNARGEVDCINPTFSGIDFPCPTASPTPTVSITPTISTTPTVTPPITVSTTPLPTPSVTKTPVATVSITPTLTPSLTISKTPAATPEATVSVTPSVTISSSPLPTPSVSKTPVATPSVTPSITPSITTTASPVPSPSVSKTPAATPSVTPSITPSITLSASPPPSPSVSKTPAATPSVTPSITPSITLSASPPPSPSVSKTPAATPSATPSITPSITTTASPAPSPSVSKTPAATPSVTPSITPSITPSATKIPAPQGEQTELIEITDDDLTALGTNGSTLISNLSWPEGATKLSIDAVPLGSTFSNGSHTSLIDGYDLNGNQRSNDGKEFGGLSCLDGISFLFIPDRPAWANIDSNNNNIATSTETSELPVYFANGSQFGAAIWDFGLVQCDNINCSSNSRTSEITKGNNGEPIAFHVRLNEDGSSESPIVPGVLPFKIGFNARWHFD